MAYPADAIDEGHARRLITQLMREAGYRIVYDSPLSVPGARATIDGLDPAAGIGFEYIARTEQNLDLTATEIARLRALPSPRILIIEGGTAEAVEADTRAFIRSIAPAQP